jgi:hypothetical protein
MIPRGSDFVDYLRVGSADPLFFAALLTGWGKAAQGRLLFARNLLTLF